VTSIYSCTDEYIQPSETSIIEGATNIGLCDGFVGHFEFFYDPDIYLIMHAALTDGAVAGDRPADGLPSAEAEDEALAGCAAAAGSSGAGGALLLLGAIAALGRRRRTGARRASC
jgi:MYXO-CTERM domain-containing protein